MVTKTITPEEINELKKIQEKYAEIYFEMGSLEIEISILEKNLNISKNKKQNLLKKFENIQIEESNLAQKLNEKYGTGTIDIDKGEITSFK